MALFLTEFEYFEHDWCAEKRFGPIREMPYLWNCSNISPNFTVYRGELGQHVWPADFITVFGFVKKL